MMDRKILSLAVPSIISNITVPLLGLIDVTIVGHLGAAAYIGAIAVGGMLFSMVYWIFGFLRMGTSGMTSQAYGRNDQKEIVLLLVRSLGIGLCISQFLIMLQNPVSWIAFKLIDSTPDVQRLALQYFRICIWGAPAVLCLYSFAGWFIGMQNSRFPMFIAITQNLINIVASLGFVYGLGMKVEGVALGTLVAQYGGLLMAGLLWWIYYGHLRGGIRWKGCWERKAMRRFFKLNRDIFFRTLCLVAVTTFFTSTGAKQGDTILAVNTLLMQLFTLFSYIMDGFAYAGEALTGLYTGAADRAGLKQMIRRLFVWGAGMSLLFTILYVCGGESFLGLLTNEPLVIQEALVYYYWALAIPLAGFAAFLWDGIFIGATASKYMLYSMLVSSLGFFALYFVLFPLWANHALWLAFLSYLLLRGIMQTLWAKKAITL